MARVNSLSDFLNDVATAIKTKKGDSTAISAADFDTEIINLPSPGIYQNKQVNITTNGNYIITPDETYDAIEQVVLNVEVAGKEDLDNVLNAQDQKITELEKALENKAAGGKVKLNIFMQEAEPEIKNGIWLQTNKTFDKVTSTKIISSEPFWNIEKTSVLKVIPYNFKHGYLTSINNDIYLISSSDNATTGKNLYKYNTLTDTYTQLTSIYQKPSSTGNTDNFGTCAIAIGTDIYMFGGSGSSSRAVKYNTLLNTYTDLTTGFPFSSNQSQICNINENIFIFGSYYSNGINKAVKYNTLIDAYTSLTNIPYNFCNGAVANVGTDIYLFGQQNGGTNCYKYDTLTDTYTKMSNIPYSFYDGSVVSVGTDIYLFGGNNQGQMFYKYDTLTDSYTKLENIPIDVQLYGSSIKVNNDIYLFAQNKVQVLTFPQLNFDDNSIVIDESSSNYETEIITTDIENGLHYKFNDVLFNEENGFDYTIPTYYGDGTQWVKFKN